MKKLAVIACTCTALAANSAVAWQSKDIDAAIRICGQMVDGDLATSKHLRDAGWSDSKDSLQTNIGNLFSGRVPYDFGLRDIGYPSPQGDQTEEQAFFDYVVTNGAFLAASALGNSVLSEIQPAYEMGDLNLSTIGQETTMPYCILSGPADLFQYVRDLPDYESAELDWLPLRDPVREGALIETARFGHMEIVATRLDRDIFAETLRIHAVEIHQDLFSILKEVTIRLGTPRSKK